MRPLLLQYYDANGVPFRAKLIANFTSSAKLGSILPGVYNSVMSSKAIGNLVKRMIGFAPERSMPTIHKTTLRKWFKNPRPLKGGKNPRPLKGSKKTVYLFCDEFTNYNDTEIGIKGILLLEKLGYEVLMTDHEESGRTWLSKGLLREAKKIINKNISIFSKIINEETPLIGIEPSAILTFIEEYLLLLS